MSMLEAVWELFLKIVLCSLEQKIVFQHKKHILQIFD